MKNILLVFLTLLLSACGSKLEGTYSNNITGVAEQKLSFTFKPDGTARMSIGSTTIPVELPYEVSGNKIKLSGVEGDQIITILDDGDLIINGLRLTKETGSKQPAAIEPHVRPPNPASITAPSAAVEPKTDCLSTVGESKIKDAINEKKGFYGDVPSSVNCEKPGNETDKLICSNSTLVLMEKLDSVAYVYAFENATGQEVNHKETEDTEWIKSIRNKSKDKSSLCEAFKEHTNGSLGGMSPYEKGN